MPKAANASDTTEAAPGVAALKTGHLALKAGRISDALVSLEEAALVAPDEPTILQPLARALAQTGRSEEAVALLRDAANRQPAMSRVRMALAHALSVNGDHEEALNEARFAYDLDNSPAVEFELSQVELMLGNYKAGLGHWESRFRLPHAKEMFANIDSPAWDGGPLDGRSLLLVGDQGYGDVIQFCRYAKQVPADGGSIALGLSPPLQRLMACLGFPIYGSVEEVPEFDIWAPMSSLPRLLGSTPDTIPKTGRYLSVAQSDIDFWRNRFIGAANGRPIVGITWSGNPTYIENGLRSLDKGARNQLLSLPEATLVSLQKDGAKEGLRPGIINVDPELGDFYDIAAAVAALDLLITTDTAIVHLAGALGIPAWLLLSTASEWRWGPTGAQSQWYDSVRIFRQKRCGDWRPVLESVAEAFDEFRPALAKNSIPNSPSEPKVSVQSALARVSAPNLAATTGGEVAKRLYTTALAHQNAGRLRPAAFHLEQILRRGELGPGGKAFLADIYRNQDRFAAAISMARRALDLAANNVPALRTLGLALYAQDRFEEALEVSQDALEQEPTGQGLRADLANVLLDMKRDDEAIDLLRAECERLPGRARPLSNLGTGLRWAGRENEAETAYRQALAIEPNYDDAKLGLALILIARTRDWNEGWKLYEGRWKSQERPRINSSAPEWRGENIEGRRLIVTPEQGLGDNIQMLRFIPQLIDKGAKVILCQPTSLLDIIPDWRLEGLVSPADPIPEADFQCPVMSLPLLLGTTLETLPIQVPYIASASDSLKRWQTCLNDLSRPRIGIVWSGNAKQRLNARRSVPFETLAPLLSTPGCEFVSLQVGPAAGDLKSVDRLNIRDLSDELGTMGDTAAAMANLDLVISVCTSVVHIAGASGRPTWLLRSSPPDWRWAEGGDRTIWYPTVRQFAQGADRSWAPVIERVRNELERCLATEPQKFLADTQEASSA
ncbi:MAG: tetratricopeptide repeat protein [Pseudomonadota bacterium]